uniref:Uncharacterized protein n=1 Tax=Panagrellus redivivus TaxID=6233 RepID=A0A7E4VC31_PANRE
MGQPNAQRRVNAEPPDVSVANGSACAANMFDRGSGKNEGIRCAYTEERHHKNRDCGKSLQKALRKPVLRAVARGVTDSSTRTKMNTRFRQYDAEGSAERNLMDRLKEETEKMAKEAPDDDVTTKFARARAMEDGSLREDCAITEPVRCEQFPVIVKAAGDDNKPEHRDTQPESFDDWWNCLRSDSRESRCEEDEAEPSYMPQVADMMFGYIKSRRMRMRFDLVDSREGRCAEDESRSAIHAAGRRMATFTLRTIQDEH